MRITFLGTGSAWPIPRIGCDCRQCAAARAGGAGARDARRRSAALLEAGAEGAAGGGPLVLIDAGPDIYRQLDSLGKAGLARIESVVITHVHPDHFLGLVDLAAALPRPVPLYCLEDNLPILERAFGYLFPRGPERRGGGGPPSFHPRVVRFGERFEAAPGLALAPFDTRHFREFSTAGIIAEEGGASAGARRRIAYAPDFRKTDADLAGLDLLALDGSTIESGGFGHISIRGGIAVAKALRPRRTIFTHIGHVKVPHDEVAALVRAEGGESFDVAWDGLCVEV